MNLRVGFYLLLLFIGQQSFSQEGIALYTDYINDNYVLIHPSMAGASNCTKFRLTARHQWFGQVNAPSLQTLTMDTKLGESSGVGLIFHNDKNGNHSQSGARLAYSKHLRMSGDYLSLNHVHLGISGGLMQSRLDETGFNLQNGPFDPTIAGRFQKDNYFNVDVGASYLKESFFLHLTYRNAASNKRELYTAIESNNISSIIANVGYSFMNPEVVMLEPSVLYNNVLESGISHLDINLKAYKNVGDGQMWFGLSYKRYFEKADQLATDQGQRSNSITPILGGKFRNVLIAYNYSQPIGSLNITQGGFHQVTVGLDLWCKPASYDCNCPAVINVK